MVLNGLKCWFKVNKTQKWFLALNCENPQILASSPIASSERTKVNHTAVF